METKKKLQDKASRLFAQNGFSSVSIKDISSAANLSTGMVNYHFKTKESLLTDILNEFYQTFETFSTELAKIKDDPNQKLQSMLQFLVDQAFNQISVMYIYYQEDTLKGSRANQYENSINNFTNHLFETFVAIVDEGVSIGQYKLVVNPLFVFYTITGTIRAVLLGNKDKFMDNTDQSAPILSIKKSLLSYHNFIINAAFSI